MIVLIDYGMGNLRSVQKAFELLGINIKISANEFDIQSSSKLVLPGVGNFENGIKNLKSKNLFYALNEEVLVKNKPILGICLGMQLMTEKSEEGNCEGFGWIDANTKKFRFEDKSLKVPHMGWNTLLMTNKNPILSKINEKDYFYFVHSYYITCKNKDEILAKTFYGHEIVSTFNRNNIFGCQFHPEKSYEAGLRILRNFAEL